MSEHRLIDSIAGSMADLTEFRKLGHESIDLVADYLNDIRSTPVFRPMTPAERDRLREQRLPADGTPADTIIDDFAQDVLPFAMGNGHPRFFGWVNSPPAPIGILAEMLAAAQDPSCDVGDIASLYLEQAVVGWLADIVGYDPETTMGLLVSGGSVAILTGLAVARQHCAETDGWDVRTDGVAGAGGKRLLTYVTDQTHSSVRKGIELLGLGSSSVRVVPTDEMFRMDPDALARMVARDRADGHRPFCVVASAGTTNTGAVDPFDRIADVAAEHGLWLHVDGAYGAVGALHPQLAGDYAGLRRADSIALDPHKWLSVPVECGCVVVRDRELMRRTFSLVPPYLRTEEGKGVGGPPSYAEYGIQQTRGFRALKVWMTLRHAGRRGLTDQVVRHVAQARHLAAMVARNPALELVVPPQLSVVCFRYLPGDGDRDPARVDAINEWVERQVQTEGRAFLTSTVLRDRFVLRASVLHYATTEDDLRALLDIVCAAGASAERALPREG